MNSIALAELNQKEAIYSEEELALVHTSAVPRHIAIMPDGNRRWAKKHHLPCISGHWRGAEALTQIVKAAVALGVKVLTVYYFSTENWRRPAEEIEGLLYLFKTYLSQQKEQMIAEGVKLDAIGDPNPFPSDVRAVLDETRAATQHCDKIELILGLNYGGRDDICRATLSILRDFSNGKLQMSDLSEKVFAKYLDTAKWEDPELLIRTSGEQRLSNFLLWQTSYTEIYTTDVLWPDFDEKDFLKAVLEFQRRERRFGGS